MARIRRPVLGTALSLLLLFTSGLAGQPDENSLRRRLEDRGISAGLTYAAESFTSTRGGVAVLGSLSSTLSFDLGRMRLARGQVFVSAQAIRGRGINDARIGATQAPSNLDETNFGKFVEAWYTDTYFAGRLRLKAGRQYADSDFGLVANGGAFLNASYGAMPTMPLPTYPDPELGASVWAAPSSRISFGFGVYGGGWLERPFEGAAPVRKRPLAVFETKIEPFSRSASQQGAYRIGVWRQNRAACVPNYGVYAAADHWFRRTETDTHRGPGVFGQWGWTPRDRNQVSRYSGGGFVYQGLTSRRVGDTAGIGVNLVRLASGKSEMIYELFYNCRLSGAVSIQPDVQWVRHAGGEGRSAFVGGLRLVLQL